MTDHNYRLTVAIDGTVDGTNADNRYAIDSSGANNTLTVNGEVLDGLNPAMPFTAVHATGANFVLNVGSTGVLYAPGCALLSGPDATVNNSGLIVATDGNALEMEGQRAEVNNSGSILAFTGAVFSAHSLNLVNDGRINSPGGEAVLIDQFSSQASGHVVNHGLIRGGIDLGDGGVDHVVNTGTIIGHIDTAGGDDLIDLRVGSFAGTIYSGAGDDTIWTNSAKNKIFEGQNNGTDTVVDFH